MRGAILTAIVLAAFGGILYVSTLSHAGFECEACMAFDGARVCRSVQAGSRGEAAQKAVQNACGVLTSGVTNTIQCTQSEPESLRCRAL